MYFNSGWSRSLRLMPQTVRRFTSPPSSTSSSQLMPTSTENHQEEMYRQWHEYYSRWHQHYYGHLYPGYPYPTDPRGPAMDPSRQAYPPPLLDATGRELSSMPSPASRQAAWVLFLFTLWMVILAIEVTDVQTVETNKQQHQRASSGPNSSSSSSSSSTPPPHQPTRKEKWEAGAELFARRQKQRAKDREEKEKQEKQQREAQQGSAPTSTSTSTASLPDSAAATSGTVEKIDAAPKNA